MAKVVNDAIIRQGGATSPTIEFYQLASGRCRLWWYAFDQDGSQSGTLAVFKAPVTEDGWQKALNKAVVLAQEAIDRAFPWTSTATPKAPPAPKTPLKEAVEFLVTEILLPFSESSLYDDYMYSDDGPGFTNEKFDAAIATLQNAAAIAQAAARLVERHDEGMLTAEEWDAMRAALK
jgi:hypothetical protein